MKEYKYIDFKEELLNNEDLYCSKCKSLLKEVSYLEESNDDLRKEIEELEEKCDEKNFLIDELLDDIDVLEKRNENLLHAFLTLSKILNQYIEM